MNVRLTHRLREQARFHIDRRSVKDVRCSNTFGSSLCKNLEPGSKLLEFTLPTVLSSKLPIGKTEPCWWTRSISIVRVHGWKIWPGLPRHGYGMHSYAIWQGRDRRSMAEILRQARNERRFPGDGDCDLPGLLQCLPANIALSLEFPTLQLLEQGRERVAAGANGIE